MHYLHLSQIVPCALRDRGGERLGRVTDLIVRLNGDDFPPLSGALAEVAGRPVFVPAADLPRGTQIVLQLKEDATDFAKEETLKRIVQRYSSFIQFPIELNGTRLNTVQAIWSRSKSEVTDAEYNAFYQYVGHDHEDPLLRLHFNADAPVSIQALLFVPQHNWENMGMGRTESDVSLYCKKVLIQPHAKGLFPDWLRFLRGVVAGPCGPAVSSEVPG